MFKIMLLAGKKGIARKWLKVEAPRMENWVDVIHDHLFCFVLYLFFDFGEKR